MADGERKYQLGFALIESSGLDLFSDSVLDHFRSGWKPGATINRYRRNWHLTRILSETDDLLFGEIGFVNQGTVETLAFDSAKQEFVPGDASGGYRVPFCVRKSDLAVAYQLYPGVVRPKTFTGAIEAFWNLAAGGQVWAVNPLGRELTYEQWRAEQSVIEKLDIRVIRPNPHYFDNDEVESLIEQTNSEYVRLVADAQDGESLDLDYPLFEQAIDHVLNEYGKAKLSGRDTANEVSIWVKVSNKLAQVLSTVVVTMAGEREAPQQAFVEAFSQIGPVDYSERLSYEDEPEE